VAPTTTGAHAQDDDQQPTEAELAEMDHQMESLKSKISLSKGKIKQLAAGISVFFLHLIQQSTLPLSRRPKPAIFNQQSLLQNKKHILFGAPY